MGFKLQRNCQESKCKNGNSKEGVKIWGSNRGFKGNICFICKKYARAVSRPLAQLLDKRKFRRFREGTKNAFRIILKNGYQTYTKALRKLGMKKLSDRRELLCLNFAKKCVKNPRTKHMFPLNNKTHEMKTRKTEKFYVQNAQSERLKNSPIIFMQNLLNSQEKN